MFLFLIDNCIILFVIKCFKIWDRSFMIFVFFNDVNVIDVWVSKKLFVKIVNYKIKVNGECCVKLSLRNIGRIF